MKKFNYKSKQGFTLIELLVVIGILAVLAAIAIPSVAGLIDRANVSADDTNANEMTNAIERFTSEYELFCQDIASGRFNKNDMDAAQSRVYNVTGVEDRDGIKQLESESGLGEKKINRDTKYPENIPTMESIVENYTKTSSSTFEPKQSDMHFWYSPDCGVVVYGEPEATKTILNGKIISGKDAKGKTLDESTVWIDLTAETLNSNTDNNNNENLTVSTTLASIGTKNSMMFKNWASDTTKIIFTTSYSDSLQITSTPAEVTLDSNKALDISQNSDKGVVAYRVTEDSEKVLYIAGKNNKVIANQYSGLLFLDLTDLKSIDFNNAFDTSNVTNMRSMFEGCTSLTKIDVSSFNTSKVTDMQRMFYGCGIMGTLDLSSFDTTNVQLMDVMFGNTKFVRLVNNFNTPNLISTNGMFLNSSINRIDSFGSQYVLALNTSKLENMESMFEGCTKLGNIDLTSFDTSSALNMRYMFKNCTSLVIVRVSNKWAPKTNVAGGIFEGAQINSVTKVS